jgi:hypothetical protein
MRIFPVRKSALALAPLAFAAVLAGEKPAQAMLTYYIFESGSDVVVQTAGILNLGTPIDFALSCGTPLLSSAFAGICVGSGNGYETFGIAGPSSFAGTAYLMGTSVDGLRTVLAGDSAIFGIDPSYVSGSEIIGSATFANQTLASLGFTTPGRVGTWTLSGTGDTINVVVGAPPQVPSPLPLLGAAAAFGYSRRLRRRVSQSSLGANPAVPIGA